jgi:transposase
MLDAIRYLVDNGIKWAAMPCDFPPYKRVHAFFTRWRDHGLTAEFHDRLRGRVRLAQGRTPGPTAAVTDSQSVKAAANVPGPTRGYDGNKKINGRRRHLIVDTLGLILMVVVTPADTGERVTAAAILPTLKERFRAIRKVWADSGYTGDLVTWAKQNLGLVLEIVRRTDDLAGFQVVPRRWVVERTFSWLMRSRRLARDYETRPDSAEAMILWSMTMVMGSASPAAGSGHSPRSRPGPRHEPAARRVHRHPAPPGQPLRLRPQVLHVRHHRLQSHRHRQLAHVQPRFTATRRPCRFEGLQQAAVVRRQRDRRVQPLTPERHLRTLRRHLHPRRSPPGQLHDSCHRLPLRGQRRDQLLHRHHTALQHRPRRHQFGLEILNQRPGSIPTHLQQPQRRRHHRPRSRPRRSDSGILPQNPAHYA